MALDRDELEVRIAEIKRRLADPKYATDHQVLQRKLAEREAELGGGSDIQLEIGEPVVTERIAAEPEVSSKEAALRSAGEAALPGLHKFMAAGEALGESAVQADDKLAAAQEADRLFTTLVKRGVSPDRARRAADQMRGFESRDYKPSDVYREERHKGLERLRLGEKQHPGLTTATSIAGAVASPLNFIPGARGVPGAIQAGLRYGAASAGGRSEAETLGEAARDIGLGTLTGGIGGAAGGVVAKGAGAAVSRLMDTDIARKASLLAGKGVNRLTLRGGIFGKGGELADVPQTTPKTVDRTVGDVAYQAASKINAEQKARIAKLRGVQGEEAKRAFADPKFNAPVDSLVAALRNELQKRSVAGVSAPLPGTVAIRRALRMALAAQKGRPWGSRSRNIAAENLRDAPRPVKVGDATEIDDVPAPLRGLADEASAPSGDVTPATAPNAPPVTAETDIAFAKTKAADAPDTTPDAPPPAPKKPRKAKTGEPEIPPRATLEELETIRKYLDEAYRYSKPAHGPGDEALRRLAGEARETRNLIDEKLGSVYKETSAKLKDIRKLRKRGGESIERDDPENYIGSLALKLGRQGTGRGSEGGRNASIVEDFRQAGYGNEADLPLAVRAREDLKLKAPSLAGPSTIGAGAWLMAHAARQGLPQAALTGGGAGLAALLALSGIQNRQQILARAVGPAIEHLQGRPSGAGGAATLLTAARRKRERERKASR